MASHVLLVSVAVLGLLPYFSAADTCLNPQVHEAVYTSTEAHMSYDAVFVIEFTLSCKNGLKELNLYAEFAGKTVPTSRLTESNNKYQVSFVDEHKNIPAGDYNIRFFDEEGYADLRKAQRSGGDDVKNVKSIFSINVHHKGSSHALSVQSEFTATMVALLVLYFAHSARSRIQA